MHVRHAALHGGIRLHSVDADPYAARAARHPIRHRTAESANRTGTFRAVLTLTRRSRSRRSPVVPEGNRRVSRISDGSTATKHPAVALPSGKLVRPVLYPAHAPRSEKSFLAAHRGADPGLKPAFDRLHDLDRVSVQGGVRFATERFGLSFARDRLTVGNEVGAR